MNSHLNIVNCNKIITKAKEILILLYTCNMSNPFNKKSIINCIKEIKVLLDNIENELIRNEKKKAG